MNYKNGRENALILTPLSKANNIIFHVIHKNVSCANGYCITKVVDRATV